MTRPVSSQPSGAPLMMLMISQLSEKLMAITAASTTASPAS